MWKKAKILNTVSNYNYVCGADKERNYLDNLVSFLKIPVLSQLSWYFRKKNCVDCAKAKFF